MATTTIKTEDARPSLSQNIEDLYAQIHAGGAFDAKKDLVTDGTHNERVDGILEKTHTIKGFKTKMKEGQSEMIMVNSNGNIITTRMKTSVYGDHSTRRYQP